MTGINVGIRTLIAFAARQGDLSQGFTPGPTAVEGSERHRAVQASRESGYAAEQRITGACGGLVLSGRIDGVGPGGNYLEEIKTHRGRPPSAESSKHQLQRSQLRAYGALYCKSHALGQIRLRLTYVDVTSGRETLIEELAPADALWAELEALCARYRGWAEAQQRHREARDAFLSALRFPLPRFRRGQRELAETVYITGKRGLTLLAQAPTGIGKTLGTLFPALRVLPEAGLDRLYYLTTRNTHKSLAVEALSLLAGEQAALRVLQLASKEAMCEHPDSACEGASCPLARGFYDRLAAARSRCAEQVMLDLPRLRQIAADHCLCPYYLGQEMARWADIVIADVSLYFDQQALLYALAREHDWRVSLLVDEAHNLIERARGMYSVSLSQAHCLALQKDCPSALRTPLDRLVRAWRCLLKAHLDGGGQVRYLHALPGELDGALRKLVPAIVDHLSENAGSAALQTLLFDAIAFLRLGEQFGEHSLCSLSGEAGRGRAVLSIHNLLPADFLQPRFEAAASCCLFSATLQPFHYYVDQFGLTMHPQLLLREFDSPFDPGQVALRLVTHISTRLGDRASSAPQIAARVVDQYRRRPGNYIVYTSSFAYQQQVVDAFIRLAADIPLMQQTPRMSEKERESFVAVLADSRETVAFAVLGGIFSEGIDLPGERLVGVFVVTLSLPPFDGFHRELERVNQRRFGQGYEYTYLYPGLRRVVQAAGRLIRTPADTGVIELIDARFSRDAVRRWLPRWWRL